MNENDRLEVVIAANFQQALTAISATNKELKNTAMLVKTVKANFDAGGKLTGFTATAQAMKETASHTKNLNANLNQTKRILNVGFNLGKLYLFWNITKRIRDIIAGWIESSVNFIETTNKFEVAMGSMTDKAYSFQNSLSEAFGTLTIDMMNFQATFKNIMSSLPGLTNESAEQVSETLVKLGLDYSSLYNVEQSTAMSRIQAALVGSVKPIRSDAGYDITEATLGMKAQELGIETSVRNLNQMEKRLLRIIVLMDQMRNTGAMQDLARTIEQPANQIKILKQQVQELGVWLGNVFIGTIGKILPYINGFVMALVAIVKTLAIFVGYTNTGSGLAEGLQEVEDASEGIAAGVGGAAKSAKELKKTLMGFDVLNVIQTPSDSSGGGGGGGGSGSLGTVNPAILKALKDYDNLMSSVKMKATEIRDKIMDWLGFIKVINPLTKEITWKLKDGSTRLGTILNIIKTAAAIIAGIKIIGRLRNIITLLSTGTKTGLKPFSSGLVAIANGVRAVITNGASLSTVLLPIVQIGGGLTTLTISLLSAYDSMKDYSEGTKGATEATLQLTASIAGATAGGALMGSTFGPAGTVLGALIGFLLGVKSATIGYTTELDKSYEANKKAAEQCENYIEAIRLQDEAIRDTTNTQLAEIDYTKQLTDELMTLVDANGKVKEGYEARVSYILEKLNSAYGTEYELIDGQITKYDELTQSIYDVINAKRAEVLLESNKAIYDEALTRDTELYIKKEEAIKANNEAIKQLEDELNEYNRINKTNIQLESLLNDEVSRANMKLNARGDFYVGNMKKAIENYELTSATEKQYVNEVKRNNEKIIAYENLKTATIKGDEAEIAKAVQELSRTYNEEIEGQTLTLEQNIKKQKELKEDTLNYYKKNNLEITEDLKKSLDNNIKITIDSLVQQTKSVKELTEEQKNAWKYLAENDKDAYVSALQGLEGETRTLVQNATGVIVSELNNATPKVETASKNINDAITKTASGEYKINFNADIDYADLKRKLQNAYNLFDKMSNVPTLGNSFKTYKNNIQNLLNQLSGYAQGGLPEMGEIFIAREAGPELVGSLGGRNAVMNNQQIVEAVSSGVANAVANVLGNGGSSYQLIIDGEQITNVVQRRLARRTNITGMAMGV